MFTMTIIKKHIQFSIHFAFHLKKNVAEATEIICTGYGENAVNVLVLPEKVVSKISSKRYQSPKPNIHVKKVLLCI